MPWCLFPGSRLKPAFLSCAVTIRARNAAFTLQPRHCTIFSLLPNGRARCLQKERRLGRASAQVDFFEELRFSGRFAGAFTHVLFEMSMTRFRLALAIIACSILPDLAGRDAFVMLSGGHSPFENNYSQYLQARAVTAFFARNYPAESTWVFFGAGNVEGENPVFADVRRTVHRNGLAIDTWLPGALPHNQPAQREQILRAFRNEILPAVAAGGTIFLFVGDHGSLADGKGESIINLWSLERDGRSEHGWRSNEAEALGVAELRQVLLEGLGKGRIVFCMTQCHSGGFHFLAVPHEVMPNPKWFTRQPAWLVLQAPKTFPRVAGFTATDQFSAAAGCDPDPLNWEGYERFLPEKLFGLNLLSLQPSGRGARSFAEAHAAATLVDATIDKPYSTSEQYLERWATFIETHLSSETNLQPSIKALVARYHRTVDGTLAKSSDRAFHERQIVFAAFIKKLTEQNPAAKDLLLMGTRQQLEAAIRASPREPSGRQAQTQKSPGQPAPNVSPPQGRGRGRRRSGELRRLWSETIRPAWKAAVDAGEVTDIPAAALQFEKHLLKKEAQGHDFLFREADAMDEEIFWESGYDKPRTLDPQKAEAIALWGANRRSQILAWARNASDERVRSAAQKITEQRPRRPSPQAQPEPNDTEPLISSTPLISKNIAAERTLFYRRVLAAWQFLLSTREQSALGRLRDLTELERTPLPRAR